jgi:cleavage and polyadenylation specificity factor subunit 3
MVTLEWVASPVNDMYADAVLCAVLQSDSMETPSYIPASAASAKVDKMHFKECLIEMLQDMFGEDSVPRTFSGDQFEVTVADQKTAKIDLASLTASCETDEIFQQIVQTALSKLHHSLIPVGETW